MESRYGNSQNMPVRKVLRMGHPLLRLIAEPVVDVRAPEIQQLIVDLRDTMHASSGAGLAAPQIGTSRRVVIYGTGAPNPRYPHAPVLPETVLINPLISPIGSTMQPEWEGCLSVPGLRGKVQRWQHLHLEAIDAMGQRIEREVEHFEARVVQHECDHLDGLLFPDRLESIPHFGFIEELIASGEIPPIPA